MNDYQPGLHKLVKHMDHLAKMKAGVPVAPIHVSIWPTLRCNLNCSYCCCKGTEKSGQPDLDFNLYMDTIDTLANYGTKAIEFSGGGEPTLWPPLGAAIKYAYRRGLKVSLITNGIPLTGVEWDALAKLSFLRISFQSVAHAESIAYPRLDKVKLSGSYIVSSPHNDLEEMYLFAKKHDMVVRVAVPRPCSETLEQDIEQQVRSLGHPLFFAPKPSGSPLGCYMAWIRAAITWDGRFIPCPSIQLSPDNGYTIPDKFTLCHIKDIKNWLMDNPAKDLGHRCQFCNCGKVQSDFYHSYIAEVADAEFV